ncbi:MAG: hypothetical protein ACLP05_04050 [Candidatus Kryptoniota bacterium]
MNHYERQLPQRAQTFANLLPQLLKCLSVFAFPVFTFFVLGFGGSDGQKYLQNVADNLSGIKDYTVDVRVHLDIENVQAQDMEAKIYYKEPDKVKIDSKGIFVLPKEVGVFNPRKFNPDSFDVSVLDTLTYEGDPAVRVLLVPKSGVHRQNVALIIDKRNWLIREISSALPRGGEAKADISYGIFGKFQLPTKVEVNFDVSNAGSSQNGFGEERRFQNGMRGKVEIYYSDYSVNSGLSDSLFEAKAEHY